MNDKDIEARLENIYDEGWSDASWYDRPLLEAYFEGERDIYMAGYEDYKESIR